MSLTTQVFHKVSNTKDIAMCGQIKEPGHYFKKGYKGIDCEKCLLIKQEKQKKNQEFKAIHRAAPHLLQVAKLAIETAKLDVNSFSERLLLVAQLHNLKILAEIALIEACPCCSQKERSA